MELFEDANIWANTGDSPITEYRSIKDRQRRNIKYKAVDSSSYDTEIYLYEKPLFNKPRLFVAVVMERKGQRQFDYIRKDGAYWDAVFQKFNDKAYMQGIKDRPTYNYQMRVVDGDNAKPDVYSKAVQPTSLYNIHNVNRPSFNLTGGACPSKGGDLARYPWGDAGAGWPNNYQEITPLCNALAIDVKLWNNLFALKSWTDPDLGIANPAVLKDGKIREYVMDANVYGRYSDPYLIKEKAENPHMVNLTPDGKIVTKPADEKNAKKVVIPLEFVGKPYYNDFYAAPEIGLTKSATLLDYCAKACKGSSTSADNGKLSAAESKDLKEKLTKLAKLLG